MSHIFRIPVGYINLRHVKLVTNIQKIREHYNEQAEFFKVCFIDGTKYSVFQHELDGGDDLKELRNQLIEFWMST